MPTSKETVFRRERMKCKNVKQYGLYYRLSVNEEWRYHGVYNKTDVLGTANNYIKYGYQVMILPREVE